MKALVQRVREASVEVDATVVGSIGPGLLVLLGVSSEDEESDAEYLVPKIANLRIFADDANRFNRSVVDVGGEVLVVSQFTLYADTRRGRRPDFTRAAPPEQAERLYEHTVSLLADNRADGGHGSVPGLHAGEVAERRTGDHHAGQRRPTSFPLVLSESPARSRTIA